VESDTKGLTERSVPRLQQLDVRGTHTLALSRAWRFGGDLWLLTQAGNPVGMLERTAGRVALRTVSEEWRGGVRRRARRVGWHLEVTKANGGEPSLQYYPRTLRPGGQLVVCGSRRYRLRCPWLRTDWRLAAMPGGEIGRIGFRDREPFRYLTVRLALGEKAADEPMLIVVILAASEAILVHEEQPSAGSFS
jgi:hypothetical protein